jgi:hypothetical protein
MTILDYSIFFILIILFIVYISLCFNSIVYPINQYNKYTVTSPNTLSYNEKIYNLFINIFGLLIQLFIIVFYMIYILPQFGNNLYVRIIEVIICASVIIIYNLPDQYKNDLFIQISYSLHPLVMAFSLILSFSLTAPNLVL